MFHKSSPHIICDDSAGWGSPFNHSNQRYVKMATMNTAVSQPTGGVGSQAMGLWTTAQHVCGHDTSNVGCNIWKYPLLWFGPWKNETKCRDRMECSFQGVRTSLVSCWGYHGGIADNGEPTLVATPMWTDPSTMLIGVPLYTVKNSGFSEYWQ